MAGTPGRSGGPRVGKPGRAYTNRRDLDRQPVRTAPGQAYGAAGEQAQAQRALPLPNQAAPTAAVPTPPQGAEVPQTVSLSAPTQRPGEPATTGLPFGAGRGPEALAPGAAGDTGFGGVPSDPVAWLRSLQSVDPTNSDLQDLIAHLDAPGGT